MNSTGEGLHEDVSLLLQLLLRSGQVTDARLEQAFREARVTKAKMEALKQLIEAGEPLPLGQLAERLHCVKSNATTLVDRLEADGLVERMHEPGDRRTVFAQVTPEGRQSCLAGMQALKEVERELLEQYSSEERLQFIAFLNRLTWLWR
jgi:DNA-binding MarR family transcriptional regulator